MLYVIDLKFIFSTFTAFVVFYLSKVLNE